jgi:chorismate mutase
VELLNQRARAAQEIGRLKRNTQMPVYEPEREREIFDNIKRVNQGPLANQELVKVYERVIDVMRSIQKEEIAPRAAAVGGDTELDAGVKD